MLNVLARETYDNSITRFETHTHQPYVTNALGLNDEIRCSINQIDIYVNIHESFIYIEGKVSKGDTAATLPELVTNAFAYLFSEIRYEINNHVVDKCRNLGIASTLKGYVTFNKNEAKLHWNYGGQLMNANGDFSACLPLKTLLGFPEHYRKIIVNTKHELVLLRSKNNNGLFKGTTIEPNVELTRVQFHVPHVEVNDFEKIQLLKIVDSKKDISVPFRSWDLYDCPMPVNVTKVSWNLKSSTNMEKPRYLILGFQKDRKKLTADASHFDHCDINDVKLFLNSEVYPYDQLNIKFDINRYDFLYNMYANFQKSYMHQERSEPLFDRKEFKEIAPLTVLDLSRQVESFKQNVQVDTRLEITFNKPIEENTIAYALIIHDRLVYYNPNTNLVKILT